MEENKNLNVNESHLEELMNQLRDAEGTFEGRAALQGLNWSTSE
ncbi:hypothetical protein [Paenibacillus sophorae]|nr:hypothetical protein [Paenibacillus sophorae]